MENTHQSDLQSKEAERQQHQRSLDQEYHRGKEAGTFCAAAPSRACHLLRDRGCVAVCVPFRASCAVLPVKERPACVQLLLGYSC